MLVNSMSARSTSPPVAPLHRFLGVPKMSRYARDAQMSSRTPSSRSVFNWRLGMNAGIRVRASRDPLSPLITWLSRDASADDDSRGPADSSASAHTGTNVIGGPAGSLLGNWLKPSTTTLSVRPQVHATTLL